MAPVVFYDLQTSGLDLDRCEVLQIGARCGGRNFSKYVMPNNGIGKGATKVNGLDLWGDELHKNEQPVNALDPWDAWNAFFDFVYSCGGNSDAVLVAYNGNRFDHLILMRSVNELGLRFDLLEVAGYAADPKTFLPSQEQKRRLPILADRYGIDNSRADDALGHVDMMKRLCRHFQIYEQDLDGSAEPLTNFEY